MIFQHTPAQCIEECRRSLLRTASHQGMLMSREDSVLTCLYSCRERQNCLSILISSMGRPEGKTQMGGQLHQNRLQTSSSTQIPSFLKTAFQARTRQDS